MQSFQFQAIAIVRSDYQQKFAIPRQPNLAPAARAWVELEPKWAEAGALEGIEQASHLWLQFVFHAVTGERTGAKVRPPRLGGNKKLGVFATRSTHRPNPIGLSVVQLLRVEQNRLYIGGADLLDGTPVLDIKPYLPWSDAIDSARHEMAAQPPAFLRVDFSDTAEQQLSKLPQGEGVHLRELLPQCLGQDPRPAYQRGDADRLYGVRIANCEVRWRHPDDHHVLVLSVLPFG